MNKPIDWSSYERTGNNAIDLVAQCVGWHRWAKKPLKTIYLSYRYYELFKAGMAVLMAKQGKILENFTEFSFDGVKILKGSDYQFDAIKCEYYVNQKSISASKN